MVSLAGGSAWQRIKILDKKEGMWRAVRWSPDGKYILLFRKAKPELFSVWILEVGKRKARKVLNEGRYQPFPPYHAVPYDGVWSCDSRYIVIREYNPKTHIAKLWLLDVMKGNKKLLVEKAYDVFPLWSPKELKLVYTADEVGYLRTSDMKIYLYDIPSDKKTLIYNGGCALSFSPNGRYLSIHIPQAEGESYKWGLAMADVETLQVFPLLDVNASFGD